jgi:hypothetical protein
MVLRPAIKRRRRMRSLKSAGLVMGVVTALHSTLR